MSLTEIIISIIDNASGSLEGIGSSAESAFSQVESSATAASSGMDAIETSAASASEAMSNVDSASIDGLAVSADSASTAMDSISSQQLNEAAASASSLGDNLGDVSREASGAATEIENVGGSVDLVSGAVSGIAAIGIAGFFSSAVQGAGAFNDSWSQLAINVGMGGQEIETVKATWSGAINTMKDETGRSAGTIRGYISSMGLAGVSSQEVITQSFQGVAGAAFATGQSVESITNSFKRVVSTGTLGNRQLISLGLTSQDVMNATGKSVDQVSAELEGMDSTQRAAFLSTIMNAKFAGDANDAFKQSWSRVTEQLGVAESYLSRIVGGLVLPVVIPAMNTATNILGGLASTIDGANGPTKTFFGALAIGAGGLAFLITSIGALTTIYQALNIQTGISAVRTGAETAAKGVNTAVTWANNAAQAIRTATMTTQTGLTAGAITTLAAMTGVTNVNTAAQNAGALAYARGTIQLIAQRAAGVAGTVATYAMAAAQWVLNAAMSANPIGIVIIAIIALIAALGYLYYHNETVRNAINWLWQGLQDLGGYIMGGLMAAWNALTMALQPVTDAVMTLWHWITGNSPGLMPALQELGALFFSVWQAISTTVLGVITAILDHIGRVLSIFTALIQGNITFTQAIQMLWNSMKVMLFQILGSVIAGIGGWVVNMSVKALQAGQAFATNLIMFLLTLPVIVAVYLNFIIQRAAAFVNSLRARAVQAGSNFLNGLISMIAQAPGKVGQELLRIVTKIMSFGGELYNKAKDLGNKIKDGLMQALGIASPGYMYYAIEGELGRIEDVMLEKQSTLGSAAGAIGGSITDGFGNPRVNLPTGIGAASTSTPQIDTAVLAASSEQTKNILQGTSNFAATTMTDMNTTMKTGFTTMADDNTNAFQTITTTTRNSLASVRSTTLKEVNNVRSSWQGMQSALVGSASTIKNQVTGSISTLTRNMATFWNRIQNPRLLVAGGYAGPGPSHSAGRYAGGFDPYTDKNLMKLFECNDPWGCYAGGWSYTTPWTSQINSSMGGWKPKFGSLGNLGLSVSSFKNSTWPVDGNLALFTTLAEKLIGPTAYDFYYNGRYTNAEALARGAFNCWDGAEILVSLAQALGLDASMVHGHWGSIGHMAARVNGVIFDTTQRQNRGVWRGTPGVSFAGPSPGVSGSDEPVEVILKHIVDLQNVPEGNSDEVIGEIVLQGMEDRQVLDAFARGAGREVNRQRRIHGV